MRRLGYPVSFEKINGQILEYEDASDGRLRYLGGIEEDDARKLFHKFKELFDEAGIKFSLVFGSLLGAVRSGTVIPSDSDLDVYVWEEEKLRDHLIDFYEKGLKVCIISPGRIYRFELEPICCIDVYIYRELRGIFSLPWRSSCIAICDHMQPRKLFTGYEEIEFLGEKVLCPKNPEKLLEFWYGSDWRIPQNKKGIYEVRSVYYLCYPFRFVKFVLKYLPKFIFNKGYRRSILLRKRKTGSIFKDRICI